MTRILTLGTIALALLTALPAPMAAGEETGPRRWTPQPPMQHARAGLGVVTVNGQIFAMGGFDGTPQTFDAVETRELAGRGSWQPAPPLPTARANLATAVLGGRVYAVGGFSADDDILPVVETFDTRSGSWTTGLPIPQPRAAAGAAALNGLLYVAGGIVPVDGGESRSTASVIAYNPARNTWRPVAPMHTARSRFRLVAAGGFLYAVGGRTEGPSLATVERYDPRSDTWRAINPMHESRVLPCVVETRNGNRPVLAAVGGAIFDDSGLVDVRRTTEVLDLTTGRWALLDVLLPVSRVSLDCAVQPDGTMLAVGGATRTGDGFVELPDVDALTLTPRDLP
ncbi:MAG TPA: hypothetical protein VGR06_37195 [Actinophytocola sp.]|uniref:Kelch repeat-containing protein n=1 Tax=Actinophytocola sp. TaxID=1872138 RepID=UPI002E01F9E0|nr:hypothetical protein [Actinophytocola sp.]